MSRIGNRARLGPLVAVFIGAAIYVGHTWSAHAPDLVSNDGIQYLEGARTLARGEGFGTSILIYDPNFTSGALPTSQTTFPPGYPLLIALGIMLGCAPVVAALLASLAGGLTTAALLWRTLGGWVGAWAALLTLLNLHGTILTTVIASDVVFTALATGALIRLATGLAGDDRRALWQGGALAGAGFACRFAGTFLLGAIGVYFGVRWLRTRTRARFLDAVAATLPGALTMGALFLRNLVLSGDADGGALDDFVRPWGGVLSEFFWGSVTLFGVATPDTGAFWVELGGFALALALLGWAVARAPAPSREALRALAADPLVRLCLVFMGLYLAALLHLSHTRNSIILLPRYMLPMLPPLLLVSGRALRALLGAGALPERHAAVVGAATLVGLVVGGWSYLPAMRETYLDGNPARRIAAHLDAPVADGRTLRDAFTAQVPPGSPLLAEPGHALGFELDHPVVGPIGAAYSGRLWDAAEVRAAVDRYDLRWAVRVRGLSPVAHIPQFWLDVDANGPPAWLVPVFEAPDATLYRITR
jgi:4-amino-4-deoxy-L-arabinose transferase-like glycosyltransferase